MRMGTVILKDKIVALCDIAGWLRRPLSKAGRSALLWTAVAMLAMAPAPETRASPDPARPSADAQQAAVARDSNEALRNGASEAMLPGRGGRRLQVAQATVSDTGQASKLQRNWAETLSCDLTNARRDIELLQRLEQERMRAESLERGLAVARRDLETQVALTNKAVEEAGRVQQAAQGGSE